MADRRLAASVAREEPGRDGWALCFGDPSQLEMLGQPSLLEDVVRQVSVLEMAFIWNRERTFCDRAIPDFVASLAWSNVVAASFLEEVAQPSMNIHSRYAAA